VKTLLIALVLAVPMSAPPAAPAQAPGQDAIYFHGNILTGAHLRPDDPSTTPPEVEAIHVVDGKIIGVGSNDDVMKGKSAATVLIDLHGAFVMPGFNDAHTHMAYAGRQRLSVNLDDVPSLEAMQAKVKAYAAGLAAGEWIQGGGWDHTKWTSHTLPTRQDMDAVSSGHPLLLGRTDGHIAIANTAALAAAGFTDATPDPSGGKIDRDAAGHATGILRETPAMSLVTAHVPPPSHETRRKALQLSIDDALAHGVTSVQDFSDWDDWLVLEEMERAGKLPLRFAEWVDFNQPLPVLETRRASHDVNDPLLHLTMLKAFMDGSLGSRTAAMNEPYSDDPDNSGITRYDQAKLNQMSAERAAAGFQLGFHAIGDLANDMALNAFAAAEQVGVPAHLPPPIVDPDATGPTGRPPVRLADFRFRIEHAQVLSPGAIDRFAQLSVIASMQPSHLLTDMKWAGARLGAERSKRAYAWKSFEDAGVVLAFGTDYPVESINPFRGLYLAVTRQDETGTQTFEPQERITLRQALFAYTQASAYAEFREKLKGRLEPGYLADFIVLDRNILKATPHELLETKVLRTVVGGVTRYVAPGQKP
jgi:predicted amidohydrolase YtcJ